MTFYARNAFAKMALVRSLRDNLKSLGKFLKSCELTENKLLSLHNSSRFSFDENEIVYEK